MYMILIFLNLLCSLIPDSSSMDLSFLLSMISKVRLVQNKHKSSQEQIRLGKMCCPSVDYTFLGCWASVQDKGSGETAVIWVITCLAWSERCVLQLADPSWLRLSALCAVSVRLIQRRTPGQRDEFCHVDFRWAACALYVSEGSGKTNTIRVTHTHAMFSQALS